MLSIENTSNWYADTSFRYADTCNSYGGTLNSASGQQVTCFLSNLIKVFIISMGNVLK